MYLLYCTYFVMYLIIFNAHTQELKIVRTEYWYVQYVIDAQLLL